MAGMENSPQKNACKGMIEIAAVPTSVCRQAKSFCQASESGLIFVINCLSGLVEMWMCGFRVNGKPNLTYARDYCLKAFSAGRVSGICSWGEQAKFDVPSYPSKLLAKQSRACWVMNSTMLLYTCTGCGVFRLYNAHLQMIEINVLFCLVLPEINVLLWLYSIYR